MRHITEQHTILCACGCGQTLISPDKWGNTPTSIKGHIANSLKKCKHEFRDGIEGKYCSACKLWQPLQDFSPRPSWDNHENRCKRCSVKRSMVYYNNHRSAINEYRRSEEYKTWFRPYQSAWAKQRQKTDPSYRLKRHLRLQLWDALKTQGIPKNNHAVALLGCTVEEFKNHLVNQFKKGMSWDNYGQAKNKRCWEIDHIIPCAAFNLADTKQLAQCFHYTNLRPLWGKDNWHKRTKLVPYQTLLLSTIKT